MNINIAQDTQRRGRELQQGKHHISNLLLPPDTSFHLICSSHNQFNFRGWQWNGTICDQRGPPMHQHTHGGDDHEFLCKPTTFKTSKQVHYCLLSSIFLVTEIVVQRCSIQHIQSKLLKIYSHKNVSNISHFSFLIVLE